MVLMKPVNAVVPEVFYNCFWFIIICDMIFRILRSGHGNQAACAVAGLCLCFFPLLPVFAGGKPQKLLPPPETEPVVNESGRLDEPGESRGEKVFRAIAEAYPDRIGKIEFLDGDWTIQVYGERFYYAEGRLLPASLRTEMNEYAPLPFYNYQKELPPWVQPTPEESARVREQESLRSSRQLKRSSHFYDALWRARSRDEAWERVKQIRFLGHQALVHYSILTELSLVEEQIQKAAKTSAAVRQWMNSISVADSWNWRNIASSQGRSYHAYGAAIDLLPKSMGGLETYWLWTARNTPEWWAVPYSRRFHPPDEVINAFESFGFIWGGKWRYYDTMHFEYRPEILALSGITRTDPRELR
jgi:hypothetical protein